jgi:sec-independent protein translocase protein TatA
MTPIFAIIDAPIIAVIIGLGILLFGADKIPKLARSMGEAKKEFESAQRGANPPVPPSGSDAPAPQPPTSQTPAPPQ